MYFKELPDVSYPSPLSDRRSDREYITVKNLFRRVKLRDDLIDQVTAFEKYEIRQGERPDIVAEEYYDNQDLDWLVLISNNITNVRDQWPLSDNELYNYAVEKYGVEGLSQVAYYETTEVKNKAGAVITPAGLQVDSDFSVTYYDAVEEGYNTKYPVTSVTNYDYEQKLQDDKRNIFTLKPRYLNIAKDDLKEMMEYKKGSTQYKSKTLKTADNIRLFT